MECELVDAELGVGGVGESDGAGGAGDFLHDDAVGLVAQGEAAIVFWGGDAEEATPLANKLYTQPMQPVCLPSMTKLLPQFRGKGVGFVGLMGKRFGDNST